MTVLKAQSLAGFQRSPDKAVRAVLIYGSDVGQVRERASALVRAVAGSLDDPFNVSRLEDDRLADDPGLLIDEARSISLMGGTKVVWVRDAGDGFLKAVSGLLEDVQAGNLVVAEAGALAKNSKLRQLFEAAANAYVVPVYADSADSLSDLVAEVMRSAGMRIEHDAEEILLGLLGSDRLASRGEVEKLVLYCSGRKQVAREDVLSVCGDAAAFTLDEAADAVFGGNIPAADLAVQRLAASGSPGSVILGAAVRHVARLQRMRADHEAGRPAEAVVRGAKPPIFFARVQAMIQQVRNWDSSELDRAGAQLQSALRQTREFPALEDAIVSRTLLSLARSARLLQRR